MKRDMDLVREILKTCADARGEVDASVFAGERHGFAEVAYHFEIMDEAGLVKSAIARDVNGVVVDARVTALTWEGNDFLAAVNDEKVWKRVKAKIAAMAGDATLGIVKALAVKYLGELMGV